jgi:hypothetical protein
MPFIPNEAQHIVNLSANGRLRATGAFHTPADQIPQIFQGLIASGKQSLTIYFHGGLTNETNARHLTGQLFPRIRDDFDSYPVFFVWESGVLDTLRSELSDIQRSPLFHKILAKLMKHVAGKLGSQLPDFLGETELAPVGDMPDSMPQLEADLKRELLPVGDPSILSIYDLVDRSQITPVTGAEERALQEDLAADIEANFLLDNMIRNARRQTVEASPEAGLGANAAFGSLPNAILADLLETTPPSTERVGDVEGFSIAVPFGAWSFVIKTFGAVISRFINGTDHGLPATVLEEIYRNIYVDKIGKFLWDGMKENAQEAYQDAPDGPANDGFPGGTLFIELLKQHLAEHGDMEVNLVGHSAGAVHICHFVKRAAASLGPDFKLNTVCFVAPGCNFEDFNQSVVAHGANIETFRIFAMTDEAERNDRLLPQFPLLYPHSLLYLVSGLFEDNPDGPLVGLARHLQRDSAQADALIRTAQTFLNATETASIVFSPTIGMLSPGERAGFTSHSGIHGPNADDTTLASLAHLIRPTVETGLAEFDLAPPEDVSERSGAIRALVTPTMENSLDEAMTRRLDAGVVAPETSGAFESGMIEAIIDENDILDHAILEGALQAGHSVARIVTLGVKDLEKVEPAQRLARWEQARLNGEIKRFNGTGWILGSARRILITNNHVLSLEIAAQSAEIQFGFENDLSGGRSVEHVMRLAPDELFLTNVNMRFDGLDYTIVALAEQAPEKFGFLEPTSGVTAQFAGQIHVVQHPGGNPKAYVLNHNRLANFDDRYVTYFSDTQGGSSGSPLFNDDFKLIGIHHIGNNRVTIAGQSMFTNLGSRIEVVVQDIARQLATSGLTEDALEFWFGNGPLLEMLKN